ncbi:MAG: serine hydrolase [Planctomycetes bacterium]|nr:serine hydrolase [Planctomycetota bacterium]
MPTLRLLFLSALLCGFAAALPAQFGFVTTSYHGVTGATHQTNFTSLSNQGYRMISLAVSGTLSNPRYSAVWQQVGGPAWAAVHGLSYTQYEQQAGVWEAAGWRAKLVAASGTGNEAVFAAMWVNDGVTVGYTQAVFASQFASMCDSQRNQGRRLTSCARYNYNSIDRYVMVFEPDATGIAWGASPGDDATAFGHKFDEFSFGHARPTLISTTDAQRYTHVWRDDRIGNWVAVAGRTSAEFDADKTLYSGQGLTLTNIAASGVGASARYAGIFQERLSPHVRSWTYTGQAVPEMAHFDTYVQSYMTSNGIRNAALAVTRHGRLAYARGYTHAEPGHFVTQPTTPFRIGSISKPLCGMVVQDLISRGTGGFGMSTNAATYLGITNTAAGAVNASVRRLLHHTSGMLDFWDEEPVRTWWINQGNPAPSMPLDESIIVRYAMAQAFQTPDVWRYSNPGNTTLGRIVQQATGQNYLTALRGRLFAPVGTLDVWQMRPRQPQGGEPPYYMPLVQLGKSNLYTDYRHLSKQYAREFWDCAGGAVCSAVTLARVVSGALCIGDDSPSLLPAARQAALFSGSDFYHVTDASWYRTDLGNGRLRFGHGGATDGFGAQCTLTTDGLCIVLLTNMTDTVASADSLVTRADQVTSWPTQDLFPNYGLPTFARRPQLQTAVTGSVPNVGDTPWIFEGVGLDQVTSVTVGAQTITSQSPNTWHSGWFVRESPQRLRVHPPQGLAPGLIMVRAASALGQGNFLFVTLTRAQQFQLRANDTVPNGQPFAAIVSRGPHPDLSFALLAWSTDLVPSVAPGVASLGIGNGFQSLQILDARQFTTSAGAVRWDFPTLAGLWQVHFQAALFDPFVADPWPLPPTNVETVQRVF